MPSTIGKGIHQYFLVHPLVKTSIDKHLKWLPFAAVFLLDLLKFSTKSGWKKQLIIAGATEAIRYTIANNLKKLTHERRPAPYTGNHSFPSGHTASSFAGAHFFHSELGSSLPVVSCTAYLAAATTAAIRLAKNRHWLKDVVAGAIVGIVSVEMAYFLVNRFNRKKDNPKNRKVDPDAEKEIMLTEAAEG